MGRRGTSDGKIDRSKRRIARSGDFHGALQRRSAGLENDPLATVKDQSEAAGEI